MRNAKSEKTHYRIKLLYILRRIFGVRVNTTHHNLYDATIPS